MAQLWGGRFTKATDQLVYNFNASITFDQKFYKQDIEGSIAHVKCLETGHFNGAGDERHHHNTAGDQGGLWRAEN